MEWQVSNNFNAYPFAEQSGPTGSDGRPLSEAIADASLFVSADVQQVHLEYLSDPSQAPVLVEFSDGADIIAAFEDGQVEQYGAWTICRWGQSFLLIETAKISNFSWPIQTSMEMVPHVVNRGTAGVQKFIVDLGGGLRFETDDIFELEEGVNLGIAASNSSDRRQATRLRIAAGANEGQTTVVLCDTEAQLFRVNGVDPIGGKISISGTDCTFATPVRGEETAPGVWSLETGKLKIHDFCRPCCDCDDYVETYANLLYPLSVALEQYAQQINELARQYEQAREQVNTALHEMAEERGVEDEDGEDEDEDPCKDVSPCLEVFVDIEASKGWYLNVTVTIVNGCAFSITDGRLFVIQRSGPKLKINDTAEFFNNSGAPIEEPDEEEDRPLFGQEPDDCETDIRELMQSLPLEIEGKRIDVGEEPEEGEERVLPSLRNGGVQQITIPMYLRQTQPIGEDVPLEYEEAHRHLPDTDLAEGHRATAAKTVIFDVTYEATVRVSANPPEHRPDIPPSVDNEHAAAALEYYRKFFVQNRRAPSLADIEGNTGTGGVRLGGLSGYGFINELLPSENKLPTDAEGGVGPAEYAYAYSLIGPVEIPKYPPDAGLNDYVVAALPALDHQGIVVKDPESAEESTVKYDAVDMTTVSNVYDVFWRETVLRNGSTPSDSVLAYHYIVSDEQHQQIESGAMEPPPSEVLSEAVEEVRSVTTHPFFMTNASEIVKQATAEKRVERPKNR